MLVLFKFVVVCWIYVDVLVCGWFLFRVIFYVCFILILVLIGYLVYLLMFWGWKGVLVMGGKVLGLLVFLLIFVVVVFVVLELVWG